MKPTASRLLLFALLAMFAFESAPAQVPGILNYQGRVTVGGTNLTTNAAKFKFALVNGDGTAVYWKNDGTTTTNEPSNAVTVAVGQGLYSTLLGDTNLANMAVVPSTVFTSANVNLRTWFSAGRSNAFVKLSPDQRLGSSGYALRAAAADSFNGQTNFPTDTTTFSFVQNNSTIFKTLSAGSTNVVATFVQRPGAAITSCSIAYTLTGSVQGTVNFYDVTGLTAGTIGTNNLIAGVGQTFTSGASGTYQCSELGGLDIPSPAVSPRIVQIVMNVSGSGGSSLINIYSITVGFTPN